jgi:hypothetical protein
MRALPFDLDAVKRLPILIIIQRGATTIRWNTSHEDVVIGGDTWIAAGGAMVSSLDYKSDGSENNADILIMAEAAGLIEPGDATRGVLDRWPISVQMFDPADPEGTAFEFLPGSTIGSINEDANRMATVAASGQLTKTGAYLTEHYSLTGREDLGDDRCKIPIMPADIGRGVDFVRPDIATGLLRVNDAYGRVRTDTTGTPTDYANVYYECTVAGTTDPTTAPTYDPTIGNTTVDGSATFIARDAWTRAATGQATGDYTIVLDGLPDVRASDATWYVLGCLYVRSGPLADYPKIPIRAWDPGTLTLTTFLPISEADIAAGTQLEIHPGCNLTSDQCFSRFNNIVNRRAEDFVPPPDAVF